MEKVELTKEQQKIVKEQIHRSACFQRVFSGADGEKVLKELAIECGVDSLLLNADMRDPLRYDPVRLAYRARGKDIWVFIQNCLKANINEAKKLLGDEKNEK